MEAALGGDLDGMPSRALLAGFEKILYGPLNGTEPLL
jgi:hypothetical protein